jgi:hypothetical protein
MRRLFGDEEADMGKIVERGAGVDIGKRFLLCCVLKGSAADEPSSETRRFDTTVRCLEQLRTWLIEEQVTHVVMESTGSYWIPVFNLLEGIFTVVLANPEEVKTGKGHKTDRKDAEHLADLLRHNHVRSSYIPPEPVRQLRDLTRRRVQLTQDATRERNRVAKLLEQANVKIGSVLTDVFGVLGLRMLLALLDGQANAADIAALARGNGQAQNTSTSGCSGRSPYDRPRALPDSKLPASFGLFGRGDRRTRRRNSATHGNRSLREGVCTVANDPGSRATFGRGNPGGNRNRYGTISNRGTDSQLGRLMSGQSRKCRHSKRPPNNSRQCLLTDRLGAMRLGRDS